MAGCKFKAFPCFPKSQILRQFPRFYGQINTFQWKSGLVESLDQFNKIQCLYNDVSKQQQQQQIDVSTGYDMCKDDAVAIARLRGNQLKELVLPHCCISTIEDDDDNNVWVAFGQVGSDFNAEVCTSYCFVFFLDTNPNPKPDLWSNE